MKLGSMSKFFLVLFGIGFGKGWDLSPCSDYHCDSLVVASIIDTNELADISVGNVSKSGKIRSADSTRIRQLNFNGMGLFAIPASIVKLNLLWILRLENNKLVSLPPEITALKFYSDIIPGYGSLQFNGLNVDSNYLCNLPPSIEAWIYGSVANNMDSKWKTTQHLSDGRDCSVNMVVGRSKAFSVKRIFVNNTFSFESEFSSISSASLYTTGGREVRRGKVALSPYGFSLEFGRLLPGIYLLKLVSGNRVALKKFAFY